MRTKLVRYTYLHDIDEIKWSITLKKYGKKIREHIFSRIRTRERRRVTRHDGGGDPPPHSLLLSFDWSERKQMSPALYNPSLSVSHIPATGTFLGPDRSASKDVGNDVL